MNPQGWTLLAIVALVVVTLVATQPRVRKPLALVVLVTALAFAIGAI